MVDDPFGHMPFKAFPVFHCGLPYVLNFYNCVVDIVNRVHLRDRPQSIYKVTNDATFLGGGEYVKLVSEFNQSCMPSKVGFDHIRPLVKSHELCFDFDKGNLSHGTIALDKLSYAEVTGNRSNRNWSASENVVKQL